MQSNFSTDCLYFKGNLPCKFHKKDSSTCPRCLHYIKQNKKILIIKLGRAGDVVRTAPLFSNLKFMFGSGIKVDFVTNYPDIIKMIDLDWENYRVIDFKVAWQLLGKTYDIIINLDKDEEACSFINNFEGTRYGFFLNSNNKIVCSETFNDIWHFGLDDNFMKEYPYGHTEGLFRAFGLTYYKDRAIWNFNKTNTKKYDLLLIPNAGTTWETRCLEYKIWEQIVSFLVNEKRHVGILSSKKEEERKIGESLQGKFGEFALSISTNSYQDWFQITNEAKVVLCLPSLGMNIANQLNIPVVLLNNIFSPHEFKNDLSNNSIILSPKRTCLSCYKSKCKSNCLNEIPVLDIYLAISKILNKRD